MSLLELLNKILVPHSHSSDSWQQLVAKIGLNESDFYSVCEFELIGNRSGPREIPAVVLIKGSDLIFVPYADDLGKISFPISSLRVVRPRHADLRFTSSAINIINAERYEIEPIRGFGSARSGTVPIKGWTKNEAKLLFETLISKGAKEIDRQTYYV